MAHSGRLHRQHEGVWHRLKHILFVNIVLVIQPRNCSLSSVKLQGVVARAVDGSDALDWPKLCTYAILTLLAGVAGVSETALHKSVVAN